MSEAEKGFLSPLSRRKNPVGSGESFHLQQHNKKSLVSSVYTMDATFTNNRSNQQRKSNAGSNQRTPGFDLVGR